MNTQEEVKWVVRYSSYPAPTIFVWRDKNDDDIPWAKDENERKKVTAYRDAQSTTLIIRNITVDDFGNYTFRIKNNRLPEKIEIFQLKCKKKLLFKN